jgi:hypothetical protein
VHIQTSRGKTRGFEIGQNQGAHSVAFVPEVFAQRAVRPARNADGGTVMTAGTKPHQRARQGARAVAELSALDDEPCTAFECSPTEEPEVCLSGNHRPQRWPTGKNPPWSTKGEALLGRLSSAVAQGRPFYLIPIGLIAEIPPIDRAEHDSTCLRNAALIGVMARHRPMPNVEGVAEDRAK